MPVPYTNTRQRLLFKHVHCLFQLLPREPSVVNSATISVEEFILAPTSPGNLTLTLTWEMPDRPYGQIENYQIRVLRENISGGEVPHAIQVTVTSEMHVCVADYNLM